MIQITILLVLAYPASELPRMICHNHPEIIALFYEAEIVEEYPRRNSHCTLVGLVESPIFVPQEHNNTLLLISCTQPKATCAQGWTQNVLELLRLSLRPP
jgi:hypothetical protein